MCFSVVFFCSTEKIPHVFFLEQLWFWPARGKDVNERCTWYEVLLVEEIHLLYMKSYKTRDILNMGVSKNRGTPKWMVYNGKPY